MINETKLHELRAEAKHYIKLGKQFPELPSSLPHWCQLRTRADGDAILLMLNQMTAMQ